MTRCRGFRPLVALVGALLALGAASAAADIQRLELDAGWNLISLSVEPADPSPAAVLAALADKLQALWSYDAATGIWSRYPQVTPGAPTITAMTSGRGYWLQVATSADLDVDGVDGGLPRGPEDVVAGWNLVGFPLLENAAWDQILTNANIRQLWTFDAGLGQFQGLVLDSAGLVVREDFVEMEPGRGYWIFSNAPTSLAPVLRTTLPSDLDLPPLLDEKPPIDERLPWTSLSQGDIDVGRDGFYDRSLTQRAVDFGDRITQVQMVVANRGSGVLRYRLAVADPEACPWLRFQVGDPARGRDELVTEVASSAASERDFHILAPLRADLPPGDYSCEFTVESNGILPMAGAEPPRRFAAAMRVGSLEGDYRLRVEIATVDGKAADLANPRITLGLFDDNQGLKAIVDPDQTLLFASDLRLAGRIIEFGTTRFALDGSVIMAAGEEGNPFPSDIRRDISLIGRRSDRAGLGGPAILSPDLEGRYFETLRGITEEPILLSGTFSGRRFSASADARDQVEAQDGAGSAIPDDGVLERTIHVDERLLLDEVDVTTNLTHEQPSNLVVSLTGPAPESTEVLLRNRSAANLGIQTFDEFHDPVESLDVFTGQLAAGDWTLRVADVVPGATGNLLEWGLDLRGTRVRDVTGSVCAGLPIGSTVILAGCGRTEIATAAGDRTFAFPNLIDCVYQLRVDESGFQVATEVVVLAGSDLEVGEICPPPGPILTPVPVVLPSSPQGTFVAMAVGAGAGHLRSPADTEPDPDAGSGLFPEQQYGLDAATWDLDRAPLGSASPGVEDTNVFLGGPPNPLTLSNEPGTNSVLDGPSGENSVRIFLSLGGPVVGRSVQGDLVLEVGALP